MTCLIHQISYTESSRLRSRIKEIVPTEYAPKLRSPPHKPPRNLYFVYFALCFLYCFPSPPVRILPQAAKKNIEPIFCYKAAFGMRLSLGRAQETGITSLAPHLENCLIRWNRLTPSNGSCLLSILQGNRVCRSTQRINEGTEIK